MKILGIICLLFFIVNIQSCAKHEITNVQIATPIALILGIVCLLSKERL